MLIHIGYPRAGSSFLQQKVFNNPRAGFALPFNRKDVQPLLGMCYGAEFDADRCREQLAPGIAAARAQGLVPAISDEGLAGSWRVLNGYDIPVKAQRLHSVFPEAKVLLVIREQRSQIRSLYSRAVQKGEWSSVKTFLTRYRGSRIAERTFFDPRVYCADKVIMLYRDLFGSDQLMVLPFELLIDDPRQYVSRIMAFAGMETDLDGVKLSPVNWSLSTASVALMRCINLLIATRHPSMLGFAIPLRLYNEYVGLMFGVDQKLIRPLSSRWGDGLLKKIDEVLGDVYADSNARTSQLIGIDLAELGYRCGK